MKYSVFTCLLPCYTVWLTIMFMGKTQIKLF